jgi:hypothetical protein
MQGKVFINFVWISGVRMIEHGTDSLSGGDLMSGVMRGDNFLKHIPLNESAPKRNPMLMPWLMEALPGNRWKHLGPEGWFDDAFEDARGQYVWTPPPSAADAAVEQICEVRHVFAQR